MLGVNGALKADSHRKKEKTKSLQKNVKHICLNEWRPFFFAISIILTYFQRLFCPQIHEAP